jgi:small subunit ribosomal protein S6
LETAMKRLYEAMFLVDPALANSDWDGITSSIKEVLMKADAEIVILKKWAEKKLAYEINHKSRGTYILCYFRADGQKIHQVERAVQLSEKFMRVLILSAENRSLEDIEKESTLQVKQQAEAPEDTTEELEEKQQAKMAESTEKIESDTPEQKQEPEEDKPDQKESE